MRKKKFNFKKAAVPFVAGSLAAGGMLLQNVPQLALVLILALEKEKRENYFIKAKFR